MSYAALLRLPHVGAVLLAALLARLGARMFALTIVLHTLSLTGSPELAGWTAFAAMAPGLIISPLAGAFLDRTGPVRGIAMDMAASAAAAVLLALVDGRGIGLVIALAAVYALTSPLSMAGIRVLLPDLVPAAMLPRANGLDTVIHAVVSTAGPSVAGILFAVGGAPASFMVIAACFAGASLCLIRLPSRRAPSRPFFGQALEGIRVVLGRPLLRGLAIAYSLNMMVLGILVVAVPVSLARLYSPGTWEMVSGFVWAGAGIAGGIGAIAAGRLRIAGQERVIMTLCLLATAVAAGPLAAAGAFGLAAGVALVGLFSGPIDVALLTLRQRRTEPALLGRVLAVSISLNSVGFPVGTALGGVLAAFSPLAAFAAAGAIGLLAAAAAWKLVPGGGGEDGNGA